MSLPKLIQKIINNVGYGQELAGADNDVVHKTSNETIEGTKTFIGETYNPEYPTSSILIRNSNISRGTQNTNSMYSQVMFADASNPPETNLGENQLSGVLGQLIYGVVGNTQRNSIGIRCYKYSSDPADNADFVGIAIGYDANDIKYSTAPETSENRTYGYDILTRNWIPKDTRIVHTTGDENIAGFKKFTNSNINIKNLTAEKGQVVASASYIQLGFVDKNDRAIGRILARGGEDGRTTIGMFCYDPTSSADTPNTQLAIWWLKNEDPYAVAPSTPLGKTGNVIITYDYIPKDTRIVHTTGNETIGGVKTFTSLMITPGVQASNDTTAVSLRGFNSVGAGISLHGGDYANTAARKGSCVINVRTGSVAKEMLIYPNGTFTWDGQTVQTSSDERLKTPISDVSSDILDSWSDVQWGEFQYLEAVEEKGENARYHVGLIAQSVDRVFKNRGRDILKYGILCHDEYEATEDEPAKDLWMVRYTEALCMEAAYNRRRVSRVEERLLALEQELAELKNSAA